MSSKEIFYYWFYAICFVVSVATGIATGFTGDSHIPPLPFAIEFFTLVIGFIFFINDMKHAKPIKAHQIGLTANGSVMAFVLLLAII
ncbi:hypothetical protein [Mucilaginibacter sp. UR6-11]|uniref:hypothetical protein n=1 Tax=Mucilaginibacter sp. UR6-11 TaxID=1435644 RepID=UPI001E35B679|nr:hypothetical protein [Mucilaginibacter sp. UR6-11]MCC8426181.1 hypothetical protein [Mucilaginibacter sp. UR6-11]